jgi:hypothetical protein
MGQPVNHNGEKARVGEDNLVLSGSRRIAVIGRLHIGLNHGPDLRDGPEEFQRNRLGLFFRRLGIFPTALEHQGDLAVQIEHYILDKHGQVVLGIVNAVISVTKIAREHDPLELMDNVDDDLLIRMAAKIDLINIPTVLVILQNGINHLLDLFFNNSHTISSPDSIILGYITPPGQSQSIPPAALSSFTAKNDKKRIK